MINLPKVSVPLLKGAFYIGIGIILGLSATDLAHFWFMEKLLLIVAVYFIISGLYYSGLYHTLMNQVNSKK
jgi:high-affinity Fe2+/Pb2+ permease